MFTAEGENKTTSKGGNKKGGERKCKCRFKPQGKF